jgi:RimJ/RimL family protein N-acetyltransferase
MDSDVRLRPFREPDLEYIERAWTDPDVSGPFQWFGFGVPDRWSRRRWEDDGFLGNDPRLVAVARDDQLLGWVMWRHGLLGPAAGVWEIGALLLPEHRGHGVGTRAQRLLVDHLFSTTQAHRIWAGTEADNIAEQRALEKCGFRQEGLLRQNVFRGGRWRDSYVYGLLRSDVEHT